MKVKRIVSILLTGSMLLSLLPVSALAAAPVFDAPAQTTAKKAAPLVQEADASRSTEEEAATRSSRDLDAENGTADSITIQLNADGEPAGGGDGTYWYYSADSGCWLYNGVFALQPSSEAEAESALQAKLYISKDAEFNSGTVGGKANNYGIISGGTFQGDVYNTGTISDGTFQGTVENYQTISGGTFQERVGNWAGGTISGGTFQGDVDNNSGGTISGGTFQGTVQNDQTISGGIFQEFVSNYQTISGGTFLGAVDNYDDGTISGGYFVTMPEGSDTGFAAVSDQADRPFHVPVNGDFSENSYTSLFVPHGSSEQPNTITVKTAAPLTDCLADGESIMGTDKVRKNDDGSYTIDVYSPASIVLVTEEPVPPTPDKPTPPTPDKPVPPTPDKPVPPTPDKPVPPTPDKPAPPTPGDPGSELDPAFSSGAAALGIVLGTAGLGYATYVYGSSLYLHYALPDGFIPSTRQELANVLWTTAGKPDPVSTALYTDIPADAIEQQKAARWCAEQGLLSDHGATFGPDTKVTNARIIRAWNSLKKVPVTITK